MSGPRIGITLGDPAGIGPEIARKAARAPEVLKVCTPVLYGTNDVSLPVGVMGRPSAEGGRISYGLVEQAVNDAMVGTIDAVATAPISKESWALAGMPWLGHTDLLAKLTGATDVRMLFFTEQISVVLATVHVPLADVPSLLTYDCLVKTIKIANQQIVNFFEIERPRIALAGINPHAGENGLMGKEEERVMRPAVTSCRSHGIDVVGPLPADTIFVRATRGEFDLVVCGYHDQGLIPIKLLHYGQAVNVTIGLPIVRTSVDHGTGFDIAGQNRADSSSMIAAVKLAARLARVKALVPPSE